LVRPQYGGSWSPNMRRGAPRQLVLSLPAFLGIALVLIYLFGILNAAGSFAQAHIPKSALRYLSVEQLLVRGISILAQPEVILVLLILSAGVAVMGFAMSRVRGPLNPAERLRVIRTGTFLGKAFLACLVAVLLFQPWQVSVSLSPILVLPVFMLVASKLRRVPHSFPRVVLVVFAAPFCACLLLGAYFLPFPQPNAHVLIAKSSGFTNCPDGVLVTHTDGIWYVWRQADHQVVSIPDAAARVTLTYPKSTTGSSPAALLSVLLF
jgi:hypothetical protein